MMIILGSCIILGQAILAIGCSVYSISLMIIGRIIFGLGGESIYIAQSTLVSEYFKENELSFALVTKSMNNLEI